VLEVSCEGFEIRGHRLWVGGHGLLSMGRGIRFGGAVLGVWASGLGGRSGVRG